MHPRLERLRTYADLPETLLLSGPTGAGKSRLARFVHEQSRRADEPFVTLDLSAIPPTMQMAELFGWRRGAFTGAVRDHEGAAARAGAGTLFIDEIDKLSLEAQAGLLRLLEERRFRVLGASSDDLDCKARLIAGSNVDLRAAIAQGRFREDLFYRINVLVVALP
ncbi:MAG: sigma 54-interacting transcriptional regulator, partial [Myxococcales bacterium]|nr:sigma 54-interacting transcriptional regulator [Myxococcales bacterium]